MPRLGESPRGRPSSFARRRRVVPAAELELDDRSKLEQGETPEVELAARRRDSRPFCKLALRQESYDRFWAGAPRLWSPRTT